MSGRFDFFRVHGEKLEIYENDVIFPSYFSKLFYFSPWNPFFRDLIVRIMYILFKDATVKILKISVMIKFCMNP